MNRRHRIARGDTPRLNDQSVIESNEADERAEPPDNLPIYRLLTGTDDAEFCKKVSGALDLGYQLYGSPSITFNGADVIAAQAVIWPNRPPYWPDHDEEIPF